MLNPPRKNYPFKCPFGVVGDRLWVKETFRIFNSLNECSHYDPCSCGQYNGKPIYRADCDDESTWHPSIHMPQWASRLTIEITDIRVERLRDISEEDARACGIWCKYDGQGCEGECHKCNATAKEGFKALWNSTFKQKWDSNPFCWVVSVRRVDSK
jgi:hypothetical protein